MPGSRTAAYLRAHPVWFVFGLALLLRLAALMYADTWGGSLQHGFFTYAGSEYVSMAQGLLTRGDFTLEFLWGHAMPSAYQPPLYPLFLALVFHLRGLPFPDALTDASSLISVQVVNCLAGGVWCVMLYALGKHLFGSRIGLIAALLGAVYPALVYSVVEVHPSNFFLLLLLLFLNAACAVTADIKNETINETRAKPILVLGITGGLLALTRSECLPLCLLLLAGIAAQRPGQRRSMALAMLVCGLVYAPWLIRNYRDFGALALTNTSGANLFRGQGPLANGGTYRTDGTEIWPASDFLAWRKTLPITPEWELRQDALLRRDTMAYIRQHPLRPILLIPNKLFLFLVRDGNHPKGRSALVWVPALLLLSCALRGFWITRAQAGRFWPIAAVPIFYALIVLIFFSLPRYRMMIDPVLMIPAACGLCPAGIRGVFAGLQPTN